LTDSIQDRKRCVVKRSKTIDMFNIIFRMKLHIDTISTTNIEKSTLN